MSTIVASNVSDGTLSIPTTYVTNGSAKAWVNFNGTGTIAARDSLNVSSLTDNGTGDYTINLTSAFGAATASVVGGIRFAVGGGTTTAETWLELASTTRFQCYALNGSGFDSEFCSTAAHGDLA